MPIRRLFSTGSKKILPRPLTHGDGVSLKWMERANVVQTHKYEYMVQQLGLHNKNMRKRKEEYDQNKSMPIIDLNQ